MRTTLKNTKQTNKGASPQLSSMTITELLPGPVFFSSVFASPVVQQVNSNKLQKIL